MAQMVTGKPTIGIIQARILTRPKIKPAFLYSVNQVTPTTSFLTASLSVSRP